MKRVLPVSFRFCLRLLQTLKGEALSVVSVCITVAIYEANVRL
jgi:hypothetical protein